MPTGGTSMGAEQLQDHFYRIKKYNIKLKVWTFKIFTLTLQSGVATQPHPIFY